MSGPQLDDGRLRAAFLRRAAGRPGRHLLERILRATRPVRTPADVVPFPRARARRTRVVRSPGWLALAVPAAAAIVVVLAIGLAAGDAGFRRVPAEADGRTALGGTRVDRDDDDEDEDEIDESDGPDGFGDD